MGNILTNIIDFFREKLIFGKEEENNGKKEKKKEEKKVLKLKKYKGKISKNKIKKREIEKRKTKRKEQRVQKEETLKLIDEYLKRSLKKNSINSQKCGNEIKTNRENNERDSTLPNDEQLKSSKTNFKKKLKEDVDITINKVGNVKDINVKENNKEDLKLTNEKNVQSAKTFFKMKSKYNEEEVPDKGNDEQDINLLKERKGDLIKKKDLTESDETPNFNNPNLRLTLEPAIKSEDFSKSKKSELMNKKYEEPGKKLEIVNLFRSIFEEIKNEKQSEKQDLEENWNFLKVRKLKTPNPESEVVKEEIENKPNEFLKLSYEKTEEDNINIPKNENGTNLKSNYDDVDHEDEISSKLSKFAKCIFLKTKDKDIEQQKLQQQQQQTEETKLSKSTQTEYYSNFSMSENQKHMRSNDKDKEIDSKLSKFERFRLIKSKAEETEKEEKFEQNKMSIVEHHSMLSESVRQKKMKFDCEGENKSSKLFKLDRFKLHKPRGKHIKKNKLSKSTQTEDVSKLSESEIYKIISSNYDPSDLDSKLSVFDKFRLLFSKDENIETEELADQNMLSKFTQTEEDSKRSAFKKLKFLSISDDEKREIKEKFLKLDKFKLLKPRVEEIENENEENKLLKTKHEDIDDNFKLFESKNLKISSFSYKKDEIDSKLEKSKLRKDRTEEAEKKEKFEQNDYSKVNFNETKNDHEISEPKNVNILNLNNKGKDPGSKMLKFEKFRLVKSKVEEIESEEKIEQNMISKYTQTEDDDDWKMFESEILRPLKSDVEEMKKCDFPKSNYSKFSKFKKFKQLKFQDDEIEEKNEFDTEEEELDLKRSQFQRMKSLWTNFEETKEEKNSIYSQPTRSNESKSNHHADENDSNLSKFSKLNIAKSNIDANNKDHSKMSTFERLKLSKNKNDKSEEEEEEKDLNLSTFEKLKRLKYKLEDPKDSEEEEIKLSKFEKLTGVNLKQQEDHKKKGLNNKKGKKKNNKFQKVVVSKASKNKKDEGIRRTIGMEITRAILMNQTGQKNGKKGKKKKGRKRRLALKLTKIIVKKASKRAKKRILKNRKKTTRRPYLKLSKGNVESDSKHSKINQVKNKKAAAGNKALPKSDASKSLNPKTTANQGYSKLKPTQNSKSNAKKQVF